MGGSGAQKYTLTHSPAKPSVRFSVVGLVAEVMRGRFESDQTRLRAKLSHHENVERSAARALFCDVTASGTKTHTHSHILYIQMLFRKVGVNVCGKRCVYVYTELKTDGRQLFIARRWFKGFRRALPSARHLSR